MITLSCKTLQSEEGIHVKQRGVCACATQRLGNGGS
jgi:hypothetical protein